jgi:hypothetical protein
LKIITDLELINQSNLLHNFDHINTDILSTPDQRMTTLEAEMKEDEHLVLEIITLPLFSGLCFAQIGAYTIRVGVKYLGEAALEMLVTVLTGSC